MVVVKGGIDWVRAGLELLIVWDPSYGGPKRPDAENRLDVRLGIGQKLKVVRKKQLTIKGTIARRHRRDSLCDGPTVIEGRPTGRYRDFTTSNFSPGVGHIFPVPAAVPDGHAEAPQGTDVLGK